LWLGWKKPKDHVEPKKVNALKQLKNKKKTGNARDRQYYQNI